MSHTIKEDKVALRKRIKAVLGQIKAREIQEQSRLVTEKVLKLPEYEKAKAISIFLSMPNREVTTTEIVLDALRKDKKVFIPYIYTSKEDPKSKVMDMLRVKDEADLQGLKADAWGIPSLSPEDVEHRENATGGIGLSDSGLASPIQPTIDLIFMPGMAFDRMNNRLGHGRGFYDKYISRLQQSGPVDTQTRLRPFLIGLALRQQLLAEGEKVPVDELDWQVDQLVIAD